MNWLEENTNTIIHGDSYEVIKNIPDKSIDCIYTDIPYLYSGGFNKHKNNCNVGINQKLVDDLNPIINGIDYKLYDEFVRVSKIGNIFIWCSKEQLLYTLNYFVERNFNFNILFWGKTNPQPLAHNTYLSDVEYCIHFTKKGVVLNEGYELKFKYYISPINKDDKDLYKHPTIKPYELVKRHLLHATHRDEIVLDPFSGSGTTCVVCKEIERQFIGIELNEEYYKISIDRLNGITANGQTSIFTNFGDDKDELGR